MLDPRGSLPPGHVEDIVARSLAEDVGRGDLTTHLLVSRLAQGVGVIRARQPMVLAGGAVAATVFAQVDSDLRYTQKHADGSHLGAGDEIGRVVGRCASILTGERTALNFLQRLSGIATLAAAAVEKVARTGVVLMDTRKTTPGLRLLEKQAVRAGGVSNHRCGLDDGILIKENHIVCCASPAAAVRQAREGSPRHLRVEVEIDRLGDLEPVIAAGAELVLLDNFQPGDLREAVRRAGDRVLLEASGGIVLQNIADYAATGVHRLSLGFLTHSAPAADLSLELTAESRPNGH
ncbi:MAG: carboxylating nicotinate-nucleotide diphosphorylase [Acidobacteriota bacterium]